MLAVVIGGGMLGAAAITAFAGRYAAISALAMGLVILCWGTVETLTLGLVGGAQLTLLSAFVVAPACVEETDAANPQPENALSPMPPRRRSWNDRDMSRTRGNEGASAEAEPRPGWIFDVEGRHAGGSTHAEIVEVLDVPGYTMYRVRWEDGSETTFVPSHDAHAHPRT